MFGQLLPEACCPARSGSHEAILTVCGGPADVPTTHRPPQEKPTLPQVSWDPLWGRAARPWAVKTESGEASSALLAVQGLGLLEDALHGGDPFLILDVEDLELQMGQGAEGSQSHESPSQGHVLPGHQDLLPLGLPARPPPDVEPPRASPPGALPRTWVSPQMGLTPQVLVVG